MLFLRNPVDIQDTTVVDDIKDSSAGEDVGLKQERSGYMGLLEMVDDLKHSTEKYVCKLCT